LRHARDRHHVGVDGTTRDAGLPLRHLIR
jgi:hypothetical protein